MRLGRRLVRWAGATTLIGALALVLLVLSAQPPREAGRIDAAAPGAVILQTPTTQPPTTTQVPTEVAPKVLEQAPPKMVAGLDEMPRTGLPRELLVAATGWLLVGTGLLLVDASARLELRRKRCR